MSGGSVSPPFCLCFVHRLHICNAACNAPTGPASPHPCHLSVAATIAEAMLRTCATAGSSQLPLIETLIEAGVNVDAPGAEGKVGSSRKRVGSEEAHRGTGAQPWLTPAPAAPSALFFDRRHFILQPSTVTGWWSAFWSRLARMSMPRTRTAKPVSRQDAAVGRTRASAPCRPHSATLLCLSASFYADMDGNDGMVDYFRSKGALYES